MEICEDVDMINTQKENRQENILEGSDFQIGPSSDKELVDSHVEPYEGMEFLSFEDAKSFYTKYAKEKGFSFRLGRVTKSRTNALKIGQEMVCSKEGFQSKKDMEREDKVRETDGTRVGCKVMIYVKKDGDKWVISRLFRDHNHDLVSPQSSQFLRVHKKKTKVQKRLIDVLDDSGLGPSKITSVLSVESGGVYNIGFGPQDVTNYLRGRRQKQLEKGDAQLMLSYFRDCQLTNPGFFYAFQMDAEGQLANCFWVDSRSRIAYKYFGDVVTFDPRYLTNRYRMPFVPFTGVNHHQQSILFGWALLWDETEESFVWLLNTWLEAMSRVHPKTIITDQDAAITNAIARVLPEVNHHFCMWHIEKKVPEHLSHVCHAHSEFKNHFYKCVHQSITIEEFESEWEAMIDKYMLQDNQWLEKIYSVKEKWIPAYIRRHFCAGMSTTQRSESMNKFFKDFLNSNTPLSKFVTQYEKAIEARYNKEREKTFKTMNSTPIERTLWPIEKEASKIYTRKFFRIFQNELVGSQEFTAEKFKCLDQVNTYKVHEIFKEEPNYFVTFHTSTKEANCSCHMFEFLGVLCRHVLTVFIKKKVYTLPSQYILCRWTRNAKKEKVKGLVGEEFQGNDGKTSSTLLFNSVMVQCLEFSERASRSKQHHDIAIEGIKKLMDKLDLLEVEEAIEGNEKLTDDVISNVSHSDLTLRDPPRVVTKGRPRTLRMKGSLELIKKGYNTCSICKGIGHNKRKCPRSNQERFNIVSGESRDFNFEASNVD